MQRDAIATHPPEEQTAHQHYDVVVIGGGPAGSTLATLLVRQGYQVLLLEREQFPRFHVGESLLPASHLIWEKLGITDALQDLNFTYKDSAEFRLGMDPHSSAYESAYVDFTAPQNWPQDDFPEHPDAYQVKRSEFDWFLLQHARSQGVVVQEQATVKQVLWEGDRATGIQWRGSSTGPGPSHTSQNYTTMADCVADCSGRQALIGRSRNLIKADRFLQTSAVFGHFRNVTPNPGREGGAISMYFIEKGWLWFIPVGPNEKRTRSHCPSVAWPLGYFDRFHRALYCLWFGFSLMAGVGWLRRNLFRLPDWSHPTEFCHQPRLNIPKRETAKLGKLS